MLWSCADTNEPLESNITCCSLRFIAMPRMCAYAADDMSPHLHRVRAQQEATALESKNGAAATAEDAVPTPVVKIDNQHDPFATVVTIEYGDRLGELLDTVRVAVDPSAPVSSLVCNMSCAEHCPCACTTDLCACILQGMSA